MSPPVKTERMWAAIRLPSGLIVADVVDRPVGTPLDIVGTPDWRPWCWQVCDEQEPNPSCHGTLKRGKVAESWWPRWQAKFDTRVWVAHREPASGHFSTSDWGAGRFATTDEAMFEAQRLGMPLVVLINGFFTQLETRTVAPAQQALL